MKAIRIHAYGDASVLRYEDAPQPAVGDNDVLIRVVGTSVNPVDWKIREGHLEAMIPYPMPFIPGWDVSGVVEAVGKKATKFKVGESVFSRPDIARNGTYAEFVSILESEVARKPATISHIEAGVLPLAGLAAWESLVTVAKVGPGQRVLVHAAAGGVGSIAVQLAKARGAYVVGTASAANRALVESLGVDEFIDYRTQRLGNATKGIDVVFDTVGGAAQQESWAVMAAGGIQVSIVSEPSAELAAKRGVRGAFVFIKPDALALEEMATLVDGGRLRPIIGAEFALEDIKRAHALSESGHSIGKIAVYVGRP
jgi:NADPH:quinone reductase-like Zn-dependent oxidoreductase